MVKTIFKSEEYWPSYMFLNLVVRRSLLLGTLALNVQDFYVNYRVGLQNHVFDHETRKSGLLSCYRLKINYFLSSYNQNLKIDIFTPQQQIPCYCKSGLGTLRLISWWRITYEPPSPPTPQPPPPPPPSPSTHPTMSEFQHSFLIAVTPQSPRV